MDRRLNLAETPLRKGGSPRKGGSQSKDGSPRKNRTAGTMVPTGAVLALVILLLAAAAFLSACGGEDETTTTTEVSEEGSSSTTTVAQTEDTEPEQEAEFPVTITDDSGTEVTIEERPERIVSTAPANTEILFALGAGDRVVGVTTFCNYPPEATEIEKIGDFQANTEKVLARDPSLVVGYAGNEDALAPVSEAGIPVMMMDPPSVEGVYTDIEAIGAAVGEPAAAEELIISMQTEIEGIANTAAETGQSPTVFYALDKTLWTSGPGSFVNELLTLADAQNIAADGPSPYFQYTPEELVEENPEVVILPQSTYQSVEEFTGDSRFAEIQAVKDGNVHIVDDITVTRPGPRLPEGIRTLAKTVHPDAFQ